jgi:Fur family transcriptional regulator, ferric uptake regulator
MNAAAYDRLLKDYRLRSTPTRQEILHLFFNKDYALSHSDIEKQVSSSSDRVTVYRTLKTFLDKGLIHKVLDDEGGLKYALCNEACTVSNHKHEHVHFKCTKCGQTSCLDIAIPAVKLPKGYRASEFNLLIQGICESCL